MFISQNVLTHFVIQALWSGLSCFSSPDRWHLIKITTLSALHSPKTIIQHAKSCSKSQAKVLPGGEEEAKLIAEQEGKVGTWENHQVSEWHSSDSTQKLICWELAF